MLVHTNGKNQHAHTYSVKPAPTKLLPSKAEIRSLVVVGSSCQLPASPGNSPRATRGTFPLSHQPPNGISSSSDSKPLTRNGGMVDRSVNPWMFPIPSFQPRMVGILIDYPNPPTCTGPGITNCSNLPDRISSDAAELTRKCSGEFDEFGVKKERARRDPLLYLQQRTRTSSF